MANEPIATPQLDQDAVNLAKAIREHETGNRPLSGASGEGGRYQWMPGTWAAGAKQYLGDANAPQTLENENKVAYSKIKAWKDQGMNPGQIASMWNSGSPDWQGKVGVNSAGVKYDVPSYVNNVYTNYQKIKAQNPPQESQQSQGAQQSQQPKQEGLLSSIGKSLVKMVAEPDIAAYNVMQAAPTAAKGLFAKLTGNDQRAQELSNQAQQQLSQAYNLPFVGQVNPAFVKNISEGNDIANLKEVAGRGAELGSFVTGGGTAEGLLSTGVKGFAQKAIPALLEGGVTGGLATGGQALKENKSMGDVASEAGKGFLYGAPFGLAGAAAPELLKGAGEIGKFGISKATGLDRSTVETILGKETSKAFQEGRAAGLNREGVTNKVIQGFQNIDNELSGLGKTYEPIRQSTQTVEIPAGYWEKKLGENGITITNGEVDRAASSKAMNQADANKINDFLKIYAKEGQVLPQDILKARAGLANLRNYDSEASGVARTVADNIRDLFNEEIGSKIKGLRELDAEYSPLRQIVDDARSQLYSKGEQKANLFSKIANASKKGREAFLTKLEKLSPGISNDIKVLAALEDVEVASGNKIGAYAQNILFGGGIAGIAGGGIPGAVIGAIVSNPHIMVPILEQFGKANRLGSALISGIVKKFGTGEALTIGEKRVVQQAINDEIQHPTVIAGLLPEKAGPGSVPIQLPGKGILEGQRNIKPQELIPGESGVVKNGGLLAAGGLMMGSQIKPKDIAKNRDQANPFVGISKEDKRAILPILYGEAGGLSEDQQKGLINSLINRGAAAQLRTGRKFSARELLEEKGQFEALGLKGKGKGYDIANQALEGKLKNPLIQKDIQKLSRLIDDAANGKIKDNIGGKTSFVGKGGKNVFKFDPQFRISSNNKK